MYIHKSLEVLPEEEGRGSRARCLLLTANDIQAKTLLNKLIQPYGEILSAHNMMPKSPLASTESRLSPRDRFISETEHEPLVSWWLEKRRGANVPNWDIVSEASIGDKKGLVLVEAKAYVQELDNKGKGASGNKGNEANHAKIQEAIQEANASLNKMIPGWNLSADQCYQLCNRFAWGWKIASLGIPVILVYLGFIGANEMKDKGSPIQDKDHWEAVVKEYGKGIVPNEAWNKEILVNKTSFYPLIRSMKLTICK